MKKYYKVILFFIKYTFQRFGIKPFVLVLFFILIKSQVSFGQSYSCGDNKVYVCHKGKKTLCIDESAVQSHLNHGDYLGPCGINECDVSATGGEITCKDTMVTLVAISNTTGITYSWLGPNNFISSLESPGTDMPGIYIVTITDVPNGCMASDSALVTKDTLRPGVTVGGGVINCNNTSTTLSGSSGTSGVIFKWTGPEGYISTQQNTVTSIPGEYILSVTNPLNSCLSFDTAIVQQNNTPPLNVTATVQDTLTCTHAFVTLSGSSTTSGVIYHWSGPNGFVSTEQSPVVITSGIYALLVADPGNECTSSASVLVEKNTKPPSDVFAIVSGILTCSDTTVTLTGSSSTSAMTYSWVNPDNFIFTGNTADVSVTGRYILIVTNPVNGCSESTTVTVEQDIETPEGLIVSVSDTLSCAVPSVILSASSTTSDVIYSWEGPQGFISNEQFTATGIPGNFSVTATNPHNDCKSVEPIIVAGEECREL
jgi:hypothetical protein